MPIGQIAQESRILENRSNIEQKWWANLSSDPKDWILAEVGLGSRKKNSMYGDFLVVYMALFFLG